jgi:hypothetical protein
VWSLIIGHLHDMVRKYPVGLLLAAAVIANRRLLTEATKL